MSHGQISIRRAIVIGLVWVNGPVIALMFGPVAVSVVLFPAASPFAWILTFLGGVALAWLYWSLAVPRWRLWAYRRVANVSALKRAAVDVGLVWKDGSIFAKTERKSVEQEALEQEIERHNDPVHGHEQAVHVHLPLPNGASAASEERARLLRLTYRLLETVEADGSGGVHGWDFLDEECVISLHGPDARELWTAIEPDLRSPGVPPGGHAILRLGPARPETTRERVELTSAGETRTTR